MLSRFIINETSGSPQDIHFKTFKKGRLGLLSLKYRPQKLNIVNVHVSNHKAPQREALVKLRRTLKAKKTSRTQGYSSWVIGTL